MNTAKVALITGITGQDGSYLAELLLEKGYEIFVLDSLENSSSKSLKNVLLILEKKNINFKERLHFLKGDLRKVSDIKKVFEETKAELWSHAEELTNAAKEIAIQVNNQESKEERDKILNLAKEAARNAGLQGAIAAGWEKGWNEGIASKS